MVSEAEVDFFCRNGFVQLRGLLDETACDHLIGETWRRLPESWVRGDPGTWNGDVTDSCHTADLVDRRGHMKFQGKEIRADPVVDAIYGLGSELHGCAEQLIGRPLEQSLVRGLYVIAPLPDRAQASPLIKPHVEAHPIQLVSVTYLDDVAPGEGGLLVWPGTHRELYPAFLSKLEFVASDAYQDLLRKYRRLTPVELPGGRGDIILMHHRLFHAPSLNRSQARLRYAVFADYRRADYRELCVQAPGGDLWEDWPGLSAARSRNAQNSDFILAAHNDFQPKRDLARTDAAHRKTEASRLARERRPGEIWLAFSRDRRISDRVWLRPFGPPIRHKMKVTLNDVPLSSDTRYDFICRLDNVQPGRNLIEVKGQLKELWFQIVKVKLPLQDSEVLRSGKIRPLEEGPISFVHQQDMGDAKAGGPDSTLFTRPRDPLPYPDSLNRLAHIVDAKGGNALAEAP